MSGGSLRELVERFHELLNGMLTDHQHRLVLHDLRGAVEAFARFRDGLAAHIDAEDTLLLPAHETLADARWPTELYRKEHRKIERFLRRIESQLDNAPRAVPDDPAWLVELLDRERRLKNLLEHHEAREEQGLLPELMMLPTTRRDQLVAHLSESWRPFLSPSTESR